MSLTVQVFALNLNVKIFPVNENSEGRLVIRLNETDFWFITTAVVNIRRMFIHQQAHELCFILCMWHSCHWAVSLLLIKFYCYQSTRNVLNMLHFLEEQFWTLSKVRMIEFIHFGGDCEVRFLHFAAVKCMVAALTLTRLSKWHTLTWLFLLLIHTKKSDCSVTIGG